MVGITLEEAIDLAVNPEEKVYMLLRIYPDTSVFELSNSNGFYYEAPEELPNVPDEPVEEPEDSAEPEPEEPDEPEEVKTPKKRPTPANAVDHGKICALYKAGWTVKAISEEMKCSGQTVYNHLVREGLYTIGEAKKEVE